MSNETNNNQTVISDPCAACSNYNCAKKTNPCQGRLSYAHMRLITQVQVADLHRHHPLVEAAIDMAAAHDRHETLIPAMEEVRDKHPHLTREQAILLWLGVNAALVPA